jgi:hypothetical protein
MINNKSYPTSTVYSKNTIHHISTPGGNKDCLTDWEWIGFCNDHNIYNTISGYKVWLEVKDSPLTTKEIVSMIEL